MMEKDKAEKFESRPDGWAQFERAVDAAIKSGPKHKPAKIKEETTGKSRVKSK